MTRSTNFTARLDAFEFSGIKEKKSARSFSPDELIDLFDHMLCPKLRLICAIAYFTGSRMGEVVALRAEDIDTDKRIISFVADNSKTGKARKMRIVDELLPFFEAYDMSETGYIFPARHNRRKDAKTQKPYILVRSVNALLKRIADENEQFTGITTHSFRRSLATDLNRQGVTEHQIAKALGHSIKPTKSVTSLYIDKPA